jgi:hypothetical protein
VLATGFLALRRLAEYFHTPYDADPAPTDPISVTREEFDEVVVQLRAGALPIRTDDDAMWAAFQGWRVNYDKALVGLAKLIVAPEGRWSSDRNGDRIVPKLGLIKPGARVHRGGRIR